MASSIVESFSPRTFQSLKKPSEAVITDVELLSSYNWVEAPEDSPTIAVPGCPARWQPPTRARRLPKDTGRFYIAQNEARNPGHPLEPLFRAVLLSRPSFNLGEVDLVSDRNNLRKLFSFVDPASDRNGLTPFTINVEVVGSTVVFCRDGTETVRVVGAHQFMGYNHEFEKAHTVNSIEGSTGHYRIISYRFGDHKLVVRHELSGHCSDVQAASATADALADSLSLLALTPADTPARAAGPDSKLRIKEQGNLVPLESTMELKTRAMSNGIVLAHVVTQLWVAQTPKLVRACHDRGLFVEPRVEDVGAYVKSWEATNQNHLRNLSGLTGKIVELARGHGDGAMFTLSYELAENKLVLRKACRPRMLPNDLYSTLVIDDTSPTIKEKAEK